MQLTTNTMSVADIEARLTDYCDDHAYGSLSNQPAALLVQNLNAWLAEGDFDSQPAAVEWAARHLSHGDGDSGSVNVYRGVTGELLRVEYHRGMGTHVTLGALIELAEAADRAGTPSPLPSWWREEWTTYVGDPAIDPAELAELNAWARPQGFYLRKLWNGQVAVYRTEPVGSSEKLVTLRTLTAACDYVFEQCRA